MNRRLAWHLMRHATRVLPPRRAQWAEAMRQEFLAIRDDREALHWAFGCLWASYMERMMSLPFLQSLPVRMLLGLMVLWQAFSSCFASILTAFYKFGMLDAAEALGRSTPGDDYRNFIPLMEAVPLSVHVAYVMAGLAFLATLAALLTRHHRAAFQFYLGGLGLTLLAILLAKVLVPAGLAPHVGPPHLFIRDYAIPVMRVMIPACVAIVLWLIAHQRPTDRAA